MRGERHALFLDLAQLCERKHLKTAGIGQDRTVPGHEFVDAAELAHDFVARAQMQVVGVGELDLCADALQILSAQRTLDRRLRADVHKDRRLDRAVRARKFPAPCRALLFEKFEHNYLI